MKVLFIPLMLGSLTISLSLPTDKVMKPNLAGSMQAKRDLSLSYAATDIGSKEGTRVKTITVIKNVAGKKDKPLKIDPKLHKSEDWGSHFRDNFNTYGVIPDVPDIDDLFEFVNKKDDKKPKEKDNPKPEKPDEQDTKSEKGGDESKKEEEEEVITLTPAPAPVEEVVVESNDEEKVEKIKGDAEIIQPKNKQGKVKSQSLDFGKYSAQETMFDITYSTPDHSVHQYFSNSATSNKKNEKYIQSPSASNFFSQPSPIIPGSPNISPSSNDYSSPSLTGRGSISVTTPSGKTFDVPLRNATDSTPYIAPNFRRTQNSPPGQEIVSSSQRPYIAPNVRKNYEVQLNNTSAFKINNNFLNTNNGQQPTIITYRNIPTNIKTNSFAIYKPNVPRSRGLRY